MRAPFRLVYLELGWATTHLTALWSLTALQQLLWCQVSASRRRGNGWTAAKDGHHNRDAVHPLALSEVTDRHQASMSRTCVALYRVPQQVGMPLRNWFGQTHRRGGACQGRSAQACQAYATGCWQRLPRLVPTLSRHPIALEHCESGRCGRTAGRTTSCQPVSFQGINNTSPTCWPSTSSSAVPVLSSLAGVVTVIACATR